MQNYSWNSNYLSLYNNYGSSLLFVNVSPDEFYIDTIGILYIKKINDSKLTGNIWDNILIVDQDLNIIESKLNNALIDDNTISGNKILNSSLDGWKIINYTIDNTKIININVWKLLWNLPYVISYSNNIIQNVEGKIITELFSDNTIDAKILLNWSLKYML